MSDLIREARRNAKNWADKPESAAMWNRFADGLERLQARVEALEAARSNWYCEMCGCSKCVEAEAAAEQEKDDD